jgi:hypothetical protein
MTIPGSDILGSDTLGSDIPRDGMLDRGSDLRGSDLRGSDAPGSDAPGSDAPGSDAPGSDVPESKAVVGRVDAAPHGARSGLSEAGGRARRFTVHFISVLLGASALTSLVAGQRAGISAALGVALAGANLFLMQKITSAMTGPGGAGGSAAWGLALPFKLVALVGVAYGLVSSGVAQPVPLAMGFALLPLTGVFLPRPSSVPDLSPRHPGQRREP